MQNLEFGGESAGTDTDEDVVITGNQEEGGATSSQHTQNTDLAALFEEEEPSFDEIKETFSVFDADNDGFIDACDLRRIVTNLGVMESYDLEEYKRMIKAYAINGDGLIDFQEFLKFMEKCLC
ncbi:hypothetical protein SASPL_107773 [Salvia splendens]|uniref:EF-hand domain-containing protein n=1 Tax=Salvia splendens TaxID=180675 RepID=A0A8X8YB07_SALSN|nr:hypothetical protein SASPL_107773 [Salvia splendens]